jgi:hypothetical protein
VDRKKDETKEENICHEGRAKSSLQSKDGIPCVGERYRKC